MSLDGAALATGFLAASVRVATPLLLAALGETVAERGGVINLGIEGAMLAGALAAAIGASAGGPWAGLAAALVAGIVVGLIFAAVAVGAGADQIITGTAITLGATGLTGAVYRSYFGATGAGLSLPTLSPIPLPGLSRIPVIGPALFDQPLLTYIGIVLVPLIWWGLFRTRGGLALRAAGEAPDTAWALGVRVKSLRTIGTVTARHCRAGRSRYSRG